MLIAESDTVEIVAAAEKRKKKEFTQAGRSLLFRFFFEMFFSITNREVSSISLTVRVKTGGSTVVVVF